MPSSPKQSIHTSSYGDTDEPTTPPGEGIRLACHFPTLLHLIRSQTKEEVSNPPHLPPPTQSGGQGTGSPFLLSLPTLGLSCHSLGHIRIPIYSMGTMVLPLTAFKFFCRKRGISTAGK